MQIPFVPAATASLPGGTPSAPASGEAASAQFDEALAASLDAEPGAPQMPVRAAADPQVADPIALAEWLLAGRGTETASGASADGGEPPAEGVQGDMLWEIPADVLGAAPAGAPVPVAPDVTEGTAQDGSERQDTTSPIDLLSQSEATKTGATTARDVTLQAGAPAPAAAGRDAKAGAPAARETEPAPAPFQRVLEPNAPPSAQGGSAEPAEPVRSTEAPLSARTVSEAPASRTAQANPAAVAQSVAPAGDRHVGVASAAAQAPSIDGARSESGMSRSDRGAHDAPIPASRAAAAAAMPAFTQMQGGGQSFEHDAQQSPAAQRLAAALAAAAPAPAADATTGSAPALSVPPGPAAVIATAPAAAGAAPAPAATPVDAENVTTLVEAMRVTARAGGWEATVRLKPEHLGEVTIALRVDGRNVSAVVQAESAGVRQWLQAQEDAVRSGMSDHGLQLDRFVVSRDGQRREGEQPHEQRQPRRQARRQPDETIPRFEIVV